MGFFVEESVEVGGRIEDLLSFDLILVGDFITGCFIGRVVGVIATSPQYRFSSTRSVFGRIIPLCFPLM